MAASGHPARYHALPVKRVVHETAEACSVVFDVPPALSDTFRYRAGQFVTLHVVLDGEPYARSYSMSSAPAVDDDLQVTVKRVPGGVVSNWLNDTLAVGVVLDVSPPAGAFVLDETAGDRELVAFAAGSGITPVFSLVKTALATTARPVRLLYANRDRASTIFADALDALVARHRDRFVVEHHHDVERGFVDAGEVTGFLGASVAADAYVCGPGAFMEVVERALATAGVDAGRVHVERFTPGDAPPAVESPPDEIEVTVTLGKQTVTVAHREGMTILQSARFGGLRAPSSCESGTCATCMARLVDGQVVMRNNEALTPEEVDEGWVLTCQSVPVTPRVHVVYE